MSATYSTWEQRDILDCDGKRLGTLTIMPGACGPHSIIRPATDYDAIRTKGQHFKIVDGNDEAILQWVRSKLYEAMPDITAARPVEFLVGEIIRRATSEDEKARRIVQIFREGGFVDAKRPDSIDHETREKTLNLENEERKRNA